MQVVIQQPLRGWEPQGSPGKSACSMLRALHRQRWRLAKHEVLAVTVKVAFSPLFWTGLNFCFFLGKDKNRYLILTVQLKCFQIATDKPSLQVFTWMTGERQQCVHAQLLNLLITLILDFFRLKNGFQSKQGSPTMSNTANGIFHQLSQLAEESNVA